MGCVMFQVGSCGDGGEDQCGYELLFEGFHDVEFCPNEDKLCTGRAIPDLIQSAVNSTSSAEVEAVAMSGCLREPQHALGSK